MEKIIKLVSLVICSIIILTGCGQKEQNQTENPNSQQGVQNVEQNSPQVPVSVSAEKAISLKELEGIWDNGTITITEVDIPQEVRKKAESEKDDPESLQTPGCNYAVIEALDKNKGVPIPAKLGIFPIDDNSGYISLTMAEIWAGESKPPETPEMPDEEDKEDSKFQYSNNTITANINSDGITADLILKASNDGAYKLEGTYEITAENGKAKVTLALSYTN